MTSWPASATEWRDALRTGEVSARDATEVHLRRIEARADLGAFVSVTAEQALAEADAVDRRRARRGDPDPDHDPELGRTTGPGRAPAPGPAPALHGLPLAHKDLLDVAGARTTHGSAALRHFVAGTDAPSVAALRAAGAVSLGKTQIPEFGLTSYSENRIAPPARHPLDPGRTPGGSSGGSATAVAAGLLPVAPGTDGGGSIRIPALACGLVGLKPGLGAVPGDLANGAVDDFGAPRLTVTGPLARDPRDAALLFDALRGAHGEPAAAAVRQAGDVRGLRIGVSDASPFSAAHPTPLSPETRAAHAWAAERLAALGHAVEEAPIAYDPRYPGAFGIAWTAGLGALRLPRGAEERLMPLTRAFRERARNRDRATHVRAAAELREFAADARRQWGAYDAILTPGLAMAPPRIGAFTELSPDDDYRLQCEWAPFSSMVNVSGLPAIAVPVPRSHWTRTPASGIGWAGARLGADADAGAGAEAGTDAGTTDGDGDGDGTTLLPMGVQLIGRAGSEHLLLQLAEQLAHA